MIQELKNEFEQTQVSSDEGTPLGKKPAHSLNSTFFKATRHQQKTTHLSKLLMATLTRSK
jgi:hypothetical protein